MVYNVIPECVPFRHQSAFSREYQTMTSINYSFFILKFFSDFFFGPNIKLIKKNTGLINPIQESH